MTTLVGVFVLLPPLVAWLSLREFNGWRKWPAIGAAAVAVLVGLVAGLFAALTPDAAHHAGWRYISAQQQERLRTALARRPGGYLAIYVPEDPDLERLSVAHRLYECVDGSGTWKASAPARPPYPKERTVSEFSDPGIVITHLRGDALADDLTNAIKDAGLGSLVTLTPVIDEGMKPGVMNVWVGARPAASGE